jgi:hypothetical protein
MLNPSSPNFSPSSSQRCYHNLGGAHSESPLGEVAESLLRLLGNDLALLGAKTSADGAGLFWAEIEWGVLLVLVEKAELLTLSRVDDGESAGDCLADVVARRGELVVCSCAGP